MTREPVNSESSVALSSAPLGAATAPRFGLGLPSWLRLPRLSAAEHPRAGRIAVSTLVASMFLIVAFASASQNVLVPGSWLAFPPWESGPFHLLFRWLPINQSAIRVGFSLVVLLMLVAYAVAVITVRSLSLRSIVTAVLALHVIVLLSPQLQLNDVFNYLGYARLGAVHHLSPYTHVINDEIHDPVFRFSSWHNLHSPYGPLFTALSYPLAFLPIPVAFWLIKTSTMLASLGLIALIYMCARQLGRDPRYAVLFVALNPVYIVYAMGGFHNDFFMLIPMIGAISLLLARRDRTAGAVLMLAVAIKFTAIILLPFLLLAARPTKRRRELVIGCVIGGVPMAALSLALFGLHLPNLADQSTLLTPFSIPNLVGLIVGADGGAPALLRVANVLVVVAVAWLVYRRRDWISSAGWATVALIASLAWLMPWYAIWVLPLAALGTSIRLRRVAIALSVFVVLTFVPMMGSFLYGHGLNPMNTAVGHASSRLQKTLAN
jgi:hypothetical protein